ncbi:MAG: flagellar protein FlgN [Sulfuriflexus sp.]|nr:flagellar protein FlgN [Sulfuriflexus sp.]
MNLDPQVIAEYLKEAGHQAQLLIQLLDDERVCISSNDGQALEEIAVNKATLAQTIQASTKVFSQQLQQAGFSADNHGLTDYFENCDQTHASNFKDTWQNLQLRLKECQDENRINGKLLGSSQRRIKQALSILQGQPVDEDLYGRGGEAVNHSTGNSLTRA